MAKQHRICRCGKTAECLHVGAQPDGSLGSVDVCEDCGRELLEAFRAEQEVLAGLIDAGMSREEANAIMIARMASKAGA